jgi:hypothetical protein
MEFEEIEEATQKSVLADLDEICPKAERVNLGAAVVVYTVLDPKVFLQLRIKILDVSPGLALSAQVDFDPLPYIEYSIYFPNIRFALKWRRTRE